MQHLRTLFAISPKAANDHMVVQMMNFIFHSNLFVFFYKVNVEKKAGQPGDEIGE